MARFTALSQSIFCVDALYVKPEIASIYLLQEADQVAIIETGTYHSLANLQATLAELGIADSQIKYVIPTHVHLDHAGGACAMMQQFEQASLVIHPRGLRHMVDPQMLVKATTAVYGQEVFDRLYGRIEPIPEERIIVARDLDRLSLNSRELLFIDTPGHAYHHFCIYDETSSGVFTGDSFGICYDPMKHLARCLLPTSPPTQFNPPAMHASVKRIMEFAPRRLYLTHYGELANPAAQLSSFERWIDQYVDLCNDMKPADANQERLLQNALMQTVLEELSVGNGGNEIKEILQNDIRLNAQGLAHWWRQTADV